MAFLAAVSVAVLAACSNSPAAPTFVEPPKPSAKLVFSYLADQADVSPGDPVTVQVVDGSLETVTLTSNLGEVPGTFSADRTFWSSSEDLDYGKTYSLAVSSLGEDGKAVEETRGFSTVSVSQGHYWSVAFSSGGGKHYSVPLNGGTFGVGQPIIARFDDVVDKRVAEGTLSVTTTPEVVGAWSWINDREVHWRPKEYWPKGTQVTVEAKILGVSFTSPSGGRVLYGKENNSATFTIGRSRIAKVDNSTKHMLVYLDGQVVKDIPVSMGREQRYRDNAGVWHDYRTLSGIHVVTEKQNPVIMRPNLPCPQQKEGTPGCDPGWYEEIVDLAVRITDSGIYVHSAPWSVGSQRYTNVSHGCINVSPANAQWYYDDAMPGDVVEVVNTGAATPTWDGTTDWDRSWEDWLAGSAVRKAPGAPNE
jgi:lipoprotein-anchoring transpeptidase ErfK/SrfK